MPSKAIDIRPLYNSYFKSLKGSPRGYFGMGIRRIPDQEFSAFEAEIDKNLRYQKTPEVGIFLTGYPERNLDTSKKQHILGWKSPPPRHLSTGDLVFVYNTNKDKKKIDCGFRINSKSNRTEPIWDDEISTDSPPTKIQISLGCRTNML